LWRSLQQHWFSQVQSRCPVTSCRKQRHLYGILILLLILFPCMALPATEECTGHNRHIPAPFRSPAALGDRVWQTCPARSVSLPGSCKSVCRVWHRLGDHAQRGGSSLFILTSGYLLALVIAIPAGLYIGWRKRLFAVAYRLQGRFAHPADRLSPYAIVLLPSFTASSIFLIFIGSFWPIFVGAVYGVFSIDQRLINSARTLGLSEHQMIRRILLYGQCRPSSPGQ